MEQKGILHYIRICQLKRLLYPLVLLVLTGLILFNLPLVEYLHVEQAAPDKPLSGAISNSRAYVRTAASDLYYTGNDYYLDGVLTGHYYYQLTDDYCRFYILRPTAGKPAETYLESRVITGRVVKFDDTTEALVREFAEELEWSTEGLMSISDPYLVNEVVYFPRYPVCYRADPGPVQSGRFDLHADPSDLSETVPHLSPPEKLRFRLKDPAGR